MQGSVENFQTQTFPNLPLNVNDQGCFKGYWIRSQLIIKHLHGHIHLLLVTGSVLVAGTELHRAKEKLVLLRGIGYCPGETPGLRQLTQKWQRPLHGSRRDILLPAPQGPQPRMWTTIGVGEESQGAGSRQSWKLPKIKHFVPPDSLSANTNSSCTSSISSWACPLQFPGC